MAYQIVINRRFSKKFQMLIAYIESEWGELVADKLENELKEQLAMLSKHPFIGSRQGRSAIRSIIFSKHNRLYYPIKKKGISH